MKLAGDNMSSTYVSIEIPIIEPQPSSLYQLSDPHSKDYSRSAVDSLNATGLNWIHQYYWPGDNYYAYVKIDDNVKESLDKLAELGEVTIIDQYYITHRGKTIGDEFKSEVK